MADPNKILMVTPEGKPIYVNPEDHDDALKSKMSPAMMYVDPKDGKDHVVKREDEVDAQKAGLKPKAEFEAEANNKMPDVGAGQAALRGIAQGFTFGGADEIGAALRSATGPTTYEQELKSGREMDRAAREQHPAISAGSDVLGTIANPLAALGGIPGAAAAGAVGGALRSEGDIADRALGSAKGLALGTAGGFAASKLPDIGRYFESRMSPTITKTLKPIPNFYEGGTKVVANPALQQAAEKSAQKSTPIIDKIWDTLGGATGASIGYKIGGAPGAAVGTTAGVVAANALRNYGASAVSAGKQAVGLTAGKLANALEAGTPIGEVIKSATAAGLPAEIIQELQKQKLHEFVDKVSKEGEPER